MARFRSWLSALTSSDDQVEADRLREQSAQRGSVAISECCVGQVVTVQGVVRSVTIEPTSQLASMEAVVYDGSGTVQLVWLGRRSIVGIEPGRRMRATGRVTARGPIPALFNPRYELLPADTS